MLNKQKGDMYGFVTHTWNAVKGRCPHDCEYCYMKVFPQGKLHFDEKELKTDLGSGNFIFVGSSTDMFAEEVDGEWIRETLFHCTKFDNTYLFQSKNPARFSIFRKFFPEKTILGTTLETNRIGFNYSAPTISERVKWMSIGNISNFRKMVTIEPILDFDVSEFVSLLQQIKPEFVNIGADSKYHNLKEPSKDKIQLLILELNKFTKINSKENLTRLM